MKVIIADTSCLIIYGKINRFEILRETFQDLNITKEVAEEFGDVPAWVNIIEVKKERRPRIWEKEKRVQSHWH